MSRTLLYISVNRHGQCTGAEFRRLGSPVFGSAERGTPLVGRSAYLSSDRRCWKGTESILEPSTCQAHASTPQPSPAAWASTCWANAGSQSRLMEGSSGHLVCHKWPGPGQAAQAVTWALLCFLCLHYPSLPSFLQPFPNSRAAKPSFDHIVTLPLSMLAPLQFPQFSGMCTSFCLLL